jgi:uncharacterized cysteine cluster protein YcgN (CxxCxxCC family)
MPDATPFWEAKTLEEMSAAEWDSLCDGCGRCCLHKLRDEETDEVDFTSVACRLLDLHSCRCTHYVTRRRHVPDCVRLTPALVREIDWLPPTCAYRRVADGQTLAWWHPLVSGTQQSVHDAGISVQDRVISERSAGPLEDYVVDWPNLVPRTRRARWVK